MTGGTWGRGRPLNRRVRRQATRPIEGTVTTDIPEPGWSADNDAGHSARHPADPQSISLGATTEHLRQLWLAGGRDITVTYDEEAIRHRAYLAHPRTETPSASTSTRSSP